jgi:hypothetical protein
MEKDISQKIREQDIMNYYRSQVIKVLMETITQTRPEVVLDLKAGKEGLPSTLQNMGLVPTDLTDLNKKWLTNATKLLDRIWESAELTADEFIKTLRDASTSGTSENK